MKVTVLVENNSRIDNYLVSEPALSLYIEADDRKILFDCGYSDILLVNAKKLNIDLSKVTDIVISHSHNDHTGGLKFIKPNKNINFIAHPHIFDTKIDEDGVSYGCDVSREYLENSFNLILTKKPYQLSKNIYFLGEIENNKSEDIDDTALVYKSSEGLIVITGCSHAGIENIINYAKKVTKCNKVHLVFGGVHLINKTAKEIEITAKNLQKEKINQIYPCHCCDLYSKIILSKFCSIKEVCCGDVFEL